MRRYAQSIIRPGAKYIDLVEAIEQTNRKLIEANKLEAGMAFPCGSSINNCAAHFTPNPGDTKILKESDVVKFDFGTHVKGLLIDCAWTVCFDPTFDNLLQAAKDATNTGIREAGIDARFNEIGDAIEEAMTAYEVTIKGKTHQIKPIRNLNGHLVARYHVYILYYISIYIYIYR